VRVVIDAVDGSFTGTPVPWIMELIGSHDLEELPM
jgi:hypothetical protein